MMWIAWIAFALVFSYIAQSISHGAIVYWPGIGGIIVMFAVSGFIYLIRRARNKNITREQMLRTFFVTTAIIGLLLIIGSFPG